MKKIIKTLFLAIITICVFSATVNAVDTNLFSVTNAQGIQGEEVTINISLNKEIEFASADFTLKYDTSKLEYVKYTELDIFKKSAMNIVKNNTDTGKIAIGYVSNPDATSLVKSPGQMLSITFKIKSNIEETTKIDIDCTSLKKDSGENIEVSDIQSEIKITTKKGGSIENYNSSSEANTNKTNTPTNAKETKNKALPNTGKNVISIGAMIFAVSIISYYFYKKYSYLRKI